MGHRIIQHVFKQFLEFTGYIDKTIAWKSKEMSGKCIKPFATPDNSFALKLIFIHNDAKILIKLFKEMQSTIVS